MTRLVSLAILGTLLASCGGNPSAPADQGGGRPTPRVTSLFQFPPLPSSGKFYIQFRDSVGASVRQEEVAGGSSEKVIEIQNLGTPETAKLVEPLTLRPAGSSVTQAPDPASARVYGLAPVLYQDRNSNGQLDAGELLYMTHDRVLYATVTFSAAYTQPIDGKTMSTVVQAKQGWSRLEHYVYLPSGSSEYRRTLTSSDDRTFWLHKETPENSM